MIKSCKKPPIDFYIDTSVGDNKVEFYSQYAGLPLKSCRVDLPVNQSGSGTPSPTNIRDFIPYTSLDFTANSVTRTFTFGQNVYIGYLDILTGELVGTHELKTIDENSGITMSNGIVVLDNFFDIDEDSIIDSVDCNCYQRAANRSNTSNVMANNPDYSFCCKNGGYATRIMIKDTRFTTIEDYKTWLQDNPVDIAVKLATPITIPLGGMEITTILGLNSLVSSVGNISAEYLKAGR